MIRTQVQLTEDQVRALKGLAAQHKKSLAEIVRQSVELYLANEARTGKAVRMQLALEAAGKFSSGTANGSSEHDRHLADAYRE